MHTGFIKLLIQTATVYSSKTRTNKGLARNLLRQEHSFHRCLRINSSSKTSDHCSWLSLLGLSWCCVVASQGHPWGIRPRFVTSRNYAFKVKHSTLADLPQRVSSKDTLQNCRGLMGLSSSLQYNGRTGDQNFVCHPVYEKSVSGRAARCPGYWETWPCGFHILSSHLPTTAWCLSGGRGRPACAFYSSYNGEVRGHGKARVMETTVISCLTEPACWRFCVIKPVVF